MNTITIDDLPFNSLSIQEGMEAAARRHKQTAVSNLRQRNADLRNVIQLVNELPHDLPNFYTIYNRLVFLQYDLMNCIYYLEENEQELFR